MDVGCVPPDLRQLDAREAELLICGVFSDERPLHGVAGLVGWRLSGTFRTDMGPVLSAPGLSVPCMLARSSWSSSRASGFVFRWLMRRVVASLNDFSYASPSRERPATFSRPLARSSSSASA